MTTEAYKSKHYSWQVPSEFEGPFDKTTRGVSAIVANNKHVLIKQRGDNKIWDLPGGSLNPGEDDIAGLQRHLHTRTGLTIKHVNGQVGPELTTVLTVRGKKCIDTAVCYFCETTGDATPGEGVEALEWLDIETAIGWMKEQAEGKIILGSNKGFVGRMSRMLLDGLSIREFPVSTDEVFPHSRNYREHPDKTKLVFFPPEISEVRLFNRIDPFNPDGSDAFVA